MTQRSPSRVPVDARRSQGNISSLSPSKAQVLKSSIGINIDIKPAATESNLATIKSTAEDGPLNLLEAVYNKEQLVQYQQQQRVAKK